MHLCWWEHCVAMLRVLEALPQLNSISLGIHACRGSQLDEGDYPEGDGWGGFLELPMLGGLTALTELFLAGWLDLPPDFRQLTQLQRLSATDVCSLYGDEFDCHAPWTGLALTRVEFVRRYRMDLPGEPGDA